MPVFNGSAYFPLALRSVLSQTHENLEVIVVDDGSHDSTEVGRTLDAHGDDRVRLIRQTNSGVAAALNRALAAATGEFFAWLSHDDLFKPAKLSRQLAFHAGLGRPEAVLFSDFELIDERGSRLSTVRIDPVPLVGSPRLSVFRGCINGCTILAPIDTLRAFAPFKAELHYTQDYDMWRRMQTRFDFFLQREVLVSYRIHPGQGTQRPEAAEASEVFWTHAILTTDRFEKILISGSEKRFHASLAGCLDGLGFFRSARLARDLSGQDSSSVPVTVVVAADGPGAADAVRSALAQTHGALDVVAVVPHGEAQEESLRRIAREDGRLRVAAASGDLDEAITFAAWTALGEYVAFQDSEARSRPDRIERQLRALQDRAALICSGEVRTDDAGRRETQFADPAWTTLLLHRSVLAAGARVGQSDPPRPGILPSSFGRQFGAVHLDEPVCSSRFLRRERRLV